MNSSRMMKQRPGFVLVPNLPDRGVATDLSWLREFVPAAELATLQAARPIVLRFSRRSEFRPAISQSSTPRA